MPYTPFEDKTPILLSNQNNVPTSDVRSTVMLRSNLKRLHATPHHGISNTLAIRQNQRRLTRTICALSTPIGNIPNCKRAANKILSINTLSVGGFLTMIYTHRRFSHDNSKGELDSGQIN